MKLRPYQIENANKLTDIINRYGLAYFAAEVRTGKTLTALETIKLLGYNNPLLITKKKAISSIQSDYQNFNFNYELTVTNYESLHKLITKHDIVVFDESHTLSAYPKPSKRTKLIKQMFSHLPMLFLTGTPAIESGSQWYHQLYVSDSSPFKQYTNFYKWCKDYVNIKEVNYGYGRASKDYSDANRSKIIKDIKHILLTFTQSQANFTSDIKEHILYCDMEERTYNIANKLLKDKVIESTSGIILGDTPAKLQNKIHQIYNGTCILEDGNTIILDKSKANYIKEKFKSKKIVLFYIFKAELKLIKEVFGFDITDDIDTFNSTDKSIVIQQTSSEGLNLSKADAIVYYNLGFSGKNYVQSKDRLTTKDRINNNVYFVLENKGITKKIYKAVTEKQSYNVQLFKRDFL